MSVESCFFLVKDQAPPKEFVVAVVNKYPTAAACVIIKDNVLDILDMKGASADDILEFINQDDNLQHRMAFWCCKADGDIAPEDMQPYNILVDGEGKVCMAAFIEGDFVSYLKTDSAFSPEKFAIDEYLRPKIELLCDKYTEQVDNDDFTSLFEDISKDEEMQSEFFGAQRGAIVLMVPGGAETFRHKSTTTLQQEGLWSSDPCGFGQKTETKTSKFSRKGAVSTTPTVSGTSVPSVPLVEEPKGVWVRKGPLLQGNAKIKEWYLNLFGFDKASAIPNDVLNNILTGHPVFLPQPRFEAIRTREIMKSTVITAKPESRDRTKSDATPDTKPKGTHTETKHIPTAGSAIPLPIMSDATKSKVAEQFLKAGNLGKTLFDNASKEAITLDQVKEVHAKHKDWYTQLADKVKIDVDWSLTWPYEMYLDLVRTESQNVAILAWDHACRLLVANARIKELTATLQLLEAQITPAKAEGVRAETLTAPPKTSKFSRKAG